MAAPGDAAPDLRAATVLAYAGGWMSGALLWLLERERPTVRFHALQSTMVFGGLTLLWAACWVASFAALILSADAFFVLQRLAQAVLAVGLIVWVACLWLAARGGPFELPLVGPFAARLTGTASHP